MPRRIFPGVISAVLLLLTQAACGRQENAGGQQLAFLDLEGSVPSGWVAEKPGTGMRLAQYRIPGPPPAQLVVFYFGPGQGGSVAANAARWSSQFTDAQGRQVAPVISKLRETAPRVTLVELHGNYARGVGMAADAPVNPDQALLAAVVETPRGNAYIQLWGPESTVSAARDEYLDLLRNLEPADGG